MPRQEVDRGMRVGVELVMGRRVPSAHAGKRTRTEGYPTAQPAVSPAMSPVIQHWRRSDMCGDSALVYRIPLIISPNPATPVLRHLDERAKVVLAEQWKVLCR